MLSVHPEDVGELCGSQCRWPGWNSGATSSLGGEALGQDRGCLRGAGWGVNGTKGQPLEMNRAS